MESNDISHSGKVIKVCQHSVFVALQTQGACGGCKAREKCGMVESEEKVVEVFVGEQSHTPADEMYHIGDRVEVRMTMGMGRVAVILAYVVPLVLLVVLLVAGSVLSLAEWCVALFGLLGVGFYFYFLYLVRAKIGQKINFTITKNGDFNLHNPNT